MSASFRSALMVVAGCSAAFLIMPAATARADVFNMPAGQTNLQFVTVGDAGNGADTTGYGSVPYAYQMGTYDVTIGQYIQFLNAVANTDTYGFTIAGCVVDGWFPFGIIQNGGPGSYSYAVAGNYSRAANCPVFFVTWGDAARFCNWLQNGQPTGTEGQGTTETGAYTLNGDTTFLMETRNADSTFVIPSENEWYKAAYYKGKGMSAGYWTYPTQSNARSNALSGSGTNNPNFPNPGYTDPTNYVTPVGALRHRPAPMARMTRAGMFINGAILWFTAATLSNGWCGAGRGRTAPWSPLPRGPSPQPIRMPTWGSAWRMFPNRATPTWTAGWTSTT